ncbi:hypothetical protein Hanom_Chr15g01338361 [Helianthus anomalus]
MTFFQSMYPCVGSSSRVCFAIFALMVLKGALQLLTKLFFSGWACFYFIEDDALLHSF